MLEFLDWNAAFDLREGRLPVFQIIAMRAGRQSVCHLWPANHLINWHNMRLNARRSCFLNQVLPPVRLWQLNPETTIIRVGFVVLVQVVAT